ncbi:phosphoribosylformylglycinamidine synthase I [Candidatus Desulforudis audaxviator MP104C]|uniref:Phosphoribosylformylglycinamidine synthase subunit PurQ n=1 Tax=Desulforudis audaxviator (strain MP104C) TaxID=477974 RepID=B1I459_DESAP|nr:phosphoribosylformylglycinamidine synthase I [Candidatus Desulforudis audaxviator]ACA59680.1 phosphoribosylformylglycinamidine synthase I [Candidatus Desulforudis audaxviator MP104C]
MRPPVCILRTDGTNCDVETAYAFEKCGAAPRLVHVNELRDGSRRLGDYGVLVIPGGFSYGDDVHSGKILAVELTSFLRDALLEFTARGRPVLGICNGFQVLVRTGLLPYARLGEISATLMANDSGRFECRWVRMRIEGRSIFTRGAEGRTVTYQVAHGEGKFYTSEAVLKSLEDGGQVVFRYVGPDGALTEAYPDNPNGSVNAVAGLADPSGLILGLMPHPERSVEPTQHPNWRRGEGGDPDGLLVFRNAVHYAREM